ncbi:MAG: transcription termination factor Rho [Phycisphaerales bacterium]|jgi:transcription termination factor Rho|nr:transcription termination factor Rho [Planctomycetota bacterium]
MSTEAPKSGQRRRRRRKKSSGDRAAAAAVATVEILPGMIPDEDTLAEGIENLEAALKKKKQPERPVLAALQALSSRDLIEQAKALSIDGANTMPRAKLVFELMRAAAGKDRFAKVSGILDIMPDGHGFLRTIAYSFLPSADDVHVSAAFIEELELRRGQEIEGWALAPAEDQQGWFSLLQVEQVNGAAAETAVELPVFENLVPLHPDRRIVLETQPDVLETRVVDLVAPMGFGQRALIVAPPRTGKTVLLQKMTAAICDNHDDVDIMVMLIDERPEEVTDFRRNTPDRVEVVASTFDEDAKRHIQVAELVMETARRRVECGRHVVVLLDSITRLARGYNNAGAGSGKIGTGGVDSGALIRPKKFFGSARNTEDGGSLTIIGTALVETGSKADEVIFEEFKGTGNSELHLTRKLVEKRVWPAIDIPASGTRREELLLDPREMELVGKLRKVVSDLSVIEAMELLRSRLAKSNSNAEFLVGMGVG